MDQMKHEILITEKMQKEGLSDLLIKDFLSKVEKVRTGETGKFYPFSSKHLVMRERQSNFVLSF